MQVSKLLSKRVFIVIVAGFVGALVFDALILLANIFYDMRHHIGPWGETFGWCLMIPSFVVTSITGEIPNAYVVNGILGAGVFSLGTIFWQFILKPLKQSSYEGK